MEGRPGSHYCLVIGCQAAHETLIYNSFMSMGCHEIWMQRKCFQPLKKFSTTTLNMFNCVFLLLLFSHWWLDMHCWMHCRVEIHYYAAAIFSEFRRNWLDNRALKQLSLISGWCHLHIQTEISWHEWESLSPRETTTIMLLLLLVLLLPLIYFMERKLSILPMIFLHFPMQRVKSPMSLRGILTLFKNYVPCIASERANRITLQQ